MNRLDVTNERQLAEKLLLECTILAETLAKFEAGVYHSSFEDQMNDRLRRQLYRLMRLARTIDPACNNVFLEHLWSDVYQATNEDCSSRLDSEWMAQT